MSQLPKKQSPENTSKTQKDAENELLYESRLDPNCILNINKRLVRVEYPGEVRNVDKAIETLGGIESIESSVADLNRKLELHFHCKNKYNRPCVADKDFKPGILLKIKKNTLEAQPGTSQDSNGDIKCDYDVEGVAVVNFYFNRLCDFQYLPLVATQPENKSSSASYIYDKIVPPELPNSDWLTSEESKNLEQFLVPVRFSHYDSSQTKLNVENTEKNESKLKSKDVDNVPFKFNTKQQKSIRKIFGKNRTQISIFANFKDKEVPTQPLEAALKTTKNRGLDEKVERVKQLFEARPIWTKAAIRYNTGLSDEHSKLILPVVAYYFINGPWRISWVKFGYDPRQDPKSRIYQTLDYRIRTAESTKLKVSAKRSGAGKTSIFLGPSQGKVSLKDDMTAKPRLELDERSYVLRPLIIPPARQMFYQLCDLILPEIQEMISQLPKSSGSFCHPKNGWLPGNFIETCRKVVNDHVLEAVQKELLEDKKMLQERETKEKERNKERSSSLDYCTQMLTNIKKGIYRNVEIQPTAVQMGQLGDEVEMISLSSDDENQYTVGEIIQSAIPETLDEPEAEEDGVSDDGQSSDEAEIDVEVVEEINQMILQANNKT